MFPELFDSVLLAPVIKRAIDRKLLDVNLVDIKSFARGSFRNIDNSPCGGGPGMILRFDVVMKALESVRKENSHVILLSPKGTVFQQKKAHALSEMDDVILICGHYEGIDARIENHVDEMLSLGDYVLTGGELGAMVVVDAVSRLLKGTLRESATVDESHENGLLEYPQYTKPVEYLGEAVPSILLSGNHGAIDTWRHQQSLLITKKLRPDLFEKYPLSDEDQKLLES